MINYRLIEIINKNFPEFDAENEQHLIKAEKILKAEQKLNNHFSQNDVDEIIEFYRTNGNRFNLIFEDQNIRNLLQNEDAQINTEQVTINHLFENLSQFAEIFSESIHQFIDFNFRENTWENLQNFVFYYPFLVGSDNESFLKTKLTEKNKIVVNTIYNPNSYELLNLEYEFAINPNFYRLQSTLDVLYFQKEILKINNNVSDHQYTTQHNKFFLGEILFALGFFQAESEELKEMLRKNSIIGEAWVNAGNKTELTPKWINVLGTDVEEKNYGKETEWFLIIILLSLIAFGCYKFFMWKDIYFYGFIGFETLVFLIFNKRLNQAFEKESNSKNDISFRRKMKKFSFKIVLLQIYAVISAIILGLIVGVGLIAAATGGAPAIIIGILIYRYIKRKK